MRGADTFTESLFTICHIGDFMPCTVQAIPQVLRSVLGCTSMK